MAEAPSIRLVGCGNMAGAMLRGWLRAGVPAGRFRVIDPAGPELPDGVARAKGPPEGGFGRAIVQLGFKPQMLDEIAPGLTASVSDETILVSILAGAELASLRARFPDAGAIVRMMPNLPVALGRGALGLVTDRPDSDGAAMIGDLAAMLGVAEWIEERHFDALSALSASGPAFVYRFIDALAAAGAEAGLDAGQATRLAIATVAGASALAAATDETLGELADRVASPGGMTRAGLDVLDADEALGRLVAATLRAAAARGREMAEAARGSR